jgi:hypothetical protein
LQASSDAMTDGIKRLRNDLEELETGLVDAEAFLRS